MPLTVTAIKKAKPETKQRKLYDELGPFLLISPKGGEEKLLRVCTRLGTLFVVLLLSGCNTFGPQLVLGSAPFFL
jgi:hypothetical protein